jgi:hypothetical protein
MSTVLKKQVATILSGAALSQGILIGDKVLCGILAPAAWTAAVLTFQVSFDDGLTWADYYDDGANEQTLVAGAMAASGKYIALDASQFAGVTWVKVRSGTTGSPVNQAADRLVTLISRKFYALD